MIKLFQFTVNSKEPEDRQYKSEERRAENPQADPLHNRYLCVGDDSEHDNCCGEAKDKIPDEVMAMLILVPKVLGMTKLPFKAIRANLLSPDFVSLSSIVIPLESD
jgi:hypothetical protein